MILYSLGRYSVCLSDFDKIRHAHTAFFICSDVFSPKISILSFAHSVISLVVNDEYLNRELVVIYSLQFLNVKLHPPVATHTDCAPFTFREACAYRTWKTPPHCSHPT